MLSKHIYLNKKVLLFQTIQKLTVNNRLSLPVLSGNLLFRAVPPQANPSTRSQGYQTNRGQHVCTRQFRPALCKPGRIITAWGEWEGVLVERGQRECEKCVVLLRAGL